ncbi:MAG TPA: hypothetical protein VMT85_03335 [Thermoanaerobaculia bacterium]|nr:hypothetical protein [Thermoanaerobaculia bacterium]
MSGAESFLEGELDGLSLDPFGVLQLADRVERAVQLEQPYLLSAVALGDDWVVGTGNDGEVLRLGRDGGVERLFDAPEDQVLALLAEPDGSLLAATSPDGKVYRIGADGTSEVLVEPRERYVWALARDAAGRLLLATGNSGKLLRWDGEALETVFDSDDSHVRSLLARPDGSVLAGTAGEGLVLEIGADDSVRTLYDAAQPEISAFAIGGSGEVYAAALASEGSQVELKPSGSSSSGSSGSSDDGSSSSPSDAPADAVAAGSRPTGFKGARSEVLRIEPDGSVEPIWSFDQETVFSMLWQGRLWAGTGMDGKLYSYRAGQMVLEQEVEELQIVAILPSSASSPAFATTNAAAVYRPAGERRPSGSATSKVLDAGAMARFGSLHWQGEIPQGSSLSFRFRSGVSPNPDRTWSQWTGERSAGVGRSGELSLDGLPRGRYVQWQAIVTGGGGDDPSLSTVELSYLQENRKPRITELTVLAPGQILVPSNFNPGNQAFEPNHPNRDGIFTTLGEGDESDRTKTLWKLGYRTLQWKADDPNDDQLEYRLSVRSAGAAPDTPWLEIADEIEDSYLSFDSTVLPDGLYRFKLTASDRPSNAEQGTEIAERTSEVVAVDHSAPVVGAVERRGGAFEVEVTDALSPLRQAQVSIDAGRWVDVAALDGLVDSRNERLRIEVPEGAQVVLLRLGDAAFNATTVDLLAVSPADGTVAEGRGGRGRPP